MAKYDRMAPDGILGTVRDALNRRETELLGPEATPSSHAVRRRPEERSDSDYRPAFSVDTDRIMHSRAYTRYIDKTQVFYLIRNDHITHRVLHVQLVSKIARTIGRFLQLNEDLIEAISLGHDIGHTPFGHDGERHLSEMCRRHGIGHFLHNVQSIQFLDKVERRGRGWNLTLQTLDGILCHDGEIHNMRLEPNRDKRFEKLAMEIDAKKSDSGLKLVPMTMEGCVVRMSDTISYIGRDLEDAIRLGVLHRSDVPQSVVSVLGNTNGTIVYNLVTDVIKNSWARPYVTFSEEVSEALRRLKAFNLERIYQNPRIKKHSDTIRSLFEILFNQCLLDLENENHGAPIYESFIENKSETYIHAHKPAEIVRDFIAGMTDRYFLHQFPENLRPKPISA